jgi:transcriptional regulator GlxA family with amidase domain
MKTNYNVGIYLFENMTMLDGYAPLQMLSFVEQFNTFTFARTKRPFPSDCGAILTPDHDFETCPDIDILVMPGGGDVLKEMKDDNLKNFLNSRAGKMQYITSVCTGALILAETGLLDGYKATTHWGWIDALESYNDIEVVDERVCIDRNRITGGGITAGLDFALTLIAEVVGEPVAQATQLVFEYRPQPPYDAGSPDTAPEQISNMVKAEINQRRQELDKHLA